MSDHAPLYGWGVLLAGAVAAASASLGVQLGFAALAVGVVGLAHGASDLAIVPRKRRCAFLTAYAAVTGGCLWWWVVAPAMALPLLLVASAIHFGVEDAPDGGATERVLRGIGPIAIPAALHAQALAGLLSVAGDVDPPPAAVMASAAVGAMAAAALLWLAIGRRDLRLGGGVMALLLLPPLVGFSLGFLILHALPATARRRNALGCGSDLAYLRRVWPVLAAAGAVLVGVAAAMLKLETSGVRALFAGIAALAMPHLLVTPWFEREGVPVAVPAFER